MNNVKLERIERGKKINLVDKQSRNHTKTGEGLPRRKTKVKIHCHIKGHVTPNVRMNEQGDVNVVES